MPRFRSLAAASVAVVASYALTSFQLLDRPDRVYVVDYPALRATPRLVLPGWRFVPRLVGRVSEFPASARTVRIDLSGGNAAASREGSRVEVEAELTYSLPAEGVLALHRMRGPGYETGWLDVLLKKRVSETLATSSYDLVRHRDPGLARTVRSALAGDLAGAGLRIESLRIVPVAGVGESSGDIRRADAAPLDRQVVLIGLDSFDWRIAEPLMKRGKMPNLERLIARGTRANLKTIRPILSPVIWTSIATGVKPSRHGIVDFVVTARDTGDLVPVTSAMRQVPALWTLLSRQGTDVGVVGWWATWPAETVRGSMVSDRVAFQLFEEEVKDDWKSTDPAKTRGKTYPPDLFDAIRPLIKAPAEVTDTDVAWFLPGEKLPASLTAEQAGLVKEFRTVIAAGETYHAIALRLLRSGAKGLDMIYYEGPDETSHLFMRYRPPLLPGVDRRDLALFGGIIDRYYERSDRFLGEVVGAAAPDATILVVSDHGFKSDNNRPPDSDPRIGRGNAADWHTPVGLLVMAGPDVRRGFDLGSASVLDIAPTILSLYGLPAARDMDGQPLADALTPGFLAGRPISWIDSYGGVRAPVQQEVTANAAGDAELIQKLRNLGYIGAERMTAHNNRGVIALDEGDVDAAIVDFEKALQAGDAGTMVRTNLARAYLTKGDLDKARSYTEAVLHDEPNNKLALLLLSSVEIKRDDLASAETHLRRATAVDPTFVQARSKLGELLRKRGRDDEALAEFRKVVEIAPISPVEYNDIGNIYRDRRRLDQAMEAYREALRVDAQYIGAYNNLGLCLQELERLDEAKALYDKALVIRPENPVLRNSMGTLLALKGDREGALAEFERAAKADPDWPVPQGNLATLLLEAGRSAEARPAFERWITIEPDSIDARLGLGLALLMLQDQDGAVARFRDVLIRDPGNFRAHTALGETLLRQGDLAEAQTHLEAAARLEPGVARVYSSLGQLYLKRGLKNEAARVLRKSLAIEPKQDEVRRLLSEAARRDGPPTD